MKYERPSGSLISYFSNKVKANGGINLAQGIPGFSPPKELLQILSENATKSNIHQYAPGIGNFDLLDKLVEHYLPEFSVTRNNLLILQGATEAISLLYLYLRNKTTTPFTVMGFDPVYESYNNLPNIYNDRFIPVYFEEDNSIDFEKLEKQIQVNHVNLIFMNSPGNPYGRVFSKEECLKMLELSEKYNFYIIFDSVYREIYFSEKPYNPLEKLNPHLFYVNSFSKLLSITGWRVGYLISHESHMPELLAIHDYIGLCAPSVLQIAIAEYLTKYNFGNIYVTDIRKKIFSSFTMLHKVLTELNFKIPPVAGGYFIWAKLPEPYSDGFRFAIDLYEKEKVAVIPGIHFSEKANSILRFNIAREEEEILAGIKGIRNFIKG